MGNVQRLERLLTRAQNLGFVIRYENLTGTGSAGCQIGTTRFLFLDPSLSSDEQAEVVEKALQTGLGWERRKAA